MSAGTEEREAVREGAERLAHLLQLGAGLLVHCQRRPGFVTELRDLGAQQVALHRAGLQVARQGGHLAGT